MGRQVGEQMVLDLMAEVAREDVEQLAASQIGRAQQLTPVPRPAALIVGLLLAELVCPVGEVTAEDDRERP